MTSGAGLTEISAAVVAAAQAGARTSAACAQIGLSPRILQRWQGPDGVIRADRRLFADRPTPANKVSQEESDRIAAICNCLDFASLPPSQIVPRLADRGTYFALKSSYYRVLREHGQTHRGGRARPSTRRKPPPASRPRRLSSCGVGSEARPGGAGSKRSGGTFEAPNTRLPGPIARVFFYLYLKVVILSRKIVGWEVHDRESADFAARVRERAVWSEKCLPSPLVLHADNGSPMKGATMKLTKERLGVIALFSRSRVSNENLFSQALFRTCKYTPNWPARGFMLIDEARAWVQGFV